MKYLPTWRVWHLLHSYQNPDKVEMLARLLRVKSRQTLLHWINNLWLWIALSLNLYVLTYLLVSPLFAVPMDYWITRLPNWIEPLLITLLALLFAWRMVDTIAKQRELGHDNLFLLPAGELVSVLDIARAHRYPFDGMIRGKWSGLLVGVVCGGLSLVSIISVGWYTPLNFAVMGVFVYGGVINFIYYLQAAISATLIALLVSQQQSRFYARVSLIILFVVLQLIFYVLIRTLLNNLSIQVLYDFSIASDGSLPNNGMYYAWSFVVQPLVIVLLREVVNLALWQVVQRRLEA